MVRFRQQAWLRRLAFAGIAALTLVAFDAVPAAATYKQGRIPLTAWNTGPTLSSF